MNKTKKYFPLILTSLLILLLIGITISFSSYYSHQDDELNAKYTDFILEHDLVDQQAILKKENDAFIGNLEFNVKNYNNDKTSPNDIKYQFRYPTNEELSNKQVDDGFGNLLVINVPSHQGTYTINFLNNENDTLVGSSKSSQNIKLEIRYQKTEDEDLSIKFNDKLSIILETTEPYKTLQVLNINISNSLVSFSITDSTYFDFKAKNVTINTAENLAQNSNLFVKLEFILSNIVFDLTRFNNEYNNLDVKLEDNKLIIDKISSASKLNLAFYIKDNATLKVKVYINDEEYNDASGLDNKENDYYIVFDKA